MRRSDGPYGRIPGRQEVSWTGALARWALCGAHRNLGSSPNRLARPAAELGRAAASFRRMPACRIGLDRGATWINVTCPTGAKPIASDGAFRAVGTDGRRSRLCNTRDRQLFRDHRPSRDHSALVRRPTAQDHSSSPSGLSASPTWSLQQEFTSPATGLPRAASLLPQPLSSHPFRCCTSH
jgi:hypothetical protein